MSRVPVSFKTGYCKVSLRREGVGSSSIGVRVVTGIQIADSEPSIFRYFGLPSRNEEWLTLSLPEEMSARVGRFCDASFVRGEGEFDCRSFLGYVMGWDVEPAAGVERRYLGTYVSAQETKPDRPYLMSSQDKGDIRHAVLGIERPGESLGVLHYERPLVIARNIDLLQAFGSTTMLEVAKVYP